MTASVLEQRALLAELDGLVSEERNPNTMDIDVLPTMELVRAINREDALVAAAIEKVLPQVAAAVDRIVAAFEQGGRLIYLGAGTSGRLGVLDAAECLPTFGVPEGMVIGLIAGGPAALVNAIEGAEDDAEAGANDLRQVELGPHDVVVGIAVSGRTPYVIGGLDYAKAVGAATVALSCNMDSAIAALAEIAISPVVGPEVLTGSTRLKSGTAQKLVLNMLTTSSMIRIGKAYQNLMVDVRPSNEKLVARAVRIIMQATGCAPEAADAALAAAANDVKLAILLVVAGVPVAEGRARLQASRGFLREALGQGPAGARRN